MLDSILRTFTPLVVGYLSTVTFFSGVDVGALTSLVGFAISAGYYVVARVLERHVNPRFGWLLLNPHEPSYEE